MRHRKRRTRLGRQPAHRKQTVKAIATHLLMHQRIKTTLVKAKEARRVAERLISIAKDDSVVARRKAYVFLNDRDIVKYLFKEIAPLFKNRSSGFTRIIPLGFRKGDGADIVFLELTERKVEEKPKRVKKEKAEKVEKPKKVERPKEKEKVEHRPAPEVEPAKKEERVVEEVRKEKAKEEEKRIEKKKDIFKGLKGFFRRRTKM